MNTRYANSWQRGAKRRCLSRPTYRALCIFALPKVIECGQGADHAVFVESITPVSAAEVCAVGAVDPGVLRLGCHCFTREDRMLVRHALDDFCRIDRIPHVQADQQRSSDLEAL